MLKDWAKYMPLSMDESGNHLQLPTGFMRLLARWGGKDLDDMQRRSGEMLANTGAGFGYMQQFQSPLSGGRSVVVVGGGDGQDLLAVTENLLVPDLRSKYQGDLVLVKGKRVESMLLGETYYSGSLPLWTWIKWNLSSQPVVLIIFLMIAAMIVATMLYRFLRRKAARRLAIDQAKE